MAQKNDIISLFLNGIFDQSARYTAFINLKNEFIVSFSPELFFQTNYKTVWSMPMKGTVGRGRYNAEDKSIIRTELFDEKNHAENVMIVDLMRNDIGKISEIGSIKVDKLFFMEKYETLFQMTSTVSGRLKQPKLSCIIKNIFPCGSVIGAPKTRAMQIISQLENEKRGIYTGSIGLISSKKAVFNVAIRTVSINKETARAELGLGSGIVADSDAEKEYNEVVLKDKFIETDALYFQLLETMLFENGCYFLLDEHLKRLRDSADYFLFYFDYDLINRKLKLLSRSFLPGKKYKIRLLLNKWGNISISTQACEPSNIRNTKVVIKKRPDADCRFFYHKTTYRPWMAQLSAAQQWGYNEVIFTNKEGKLLEGAYTNLFIRKNNTWYTPPIKLGILNGCYRKRLMSNGFAREEIIDLEELKNADKVILTNSVKKIITVNEIYDENNQCLFKKASLPLDKKECSL